RPLDDAQEFFHVLARRFLAGKRAEENRQLRCKFFVFENLVGDAARVHGGIFEEFEPVVRARLQSELPGPGAEGFLVARRLEDLALDLAPIAGVMAVLQTKLAQAEPLPRPDFFDEFSKHRFNVTSWYNIYHTRKELSNKIFQ